MQEILGYTAVLLAGYVGGLATGLLLRDKFLMLDSEVKSILRDIKAKL